MDRDTPGREQTLRFLAAPTDAGYSGSVGGGRVLEWIDRAGFAAAVGWSGRYCVTAYVGNVHFTRPVAVGDLVEATGRLIYTGRTSMHVHVTVRSGSPRGGELAPATECLMVFVAVDDDGRPTPVPQLPDGDEEDLEQKASAVRRIDLRAQIAAAMAEQSYTAASTAPSVVLRFLASPTDVNFGGRVHGGIVMRWIDEAAHVLVTQWTGDAANVAVYAGGVRFYQPLRIGDLVEVEARLIFTGRTSMHVSVHVRSGSPADGERRLTTHCLIVFVSLSAEGAAVEARSWEPETDEDVHLYEHAQHLIELRAAAHDIIPA
ncbi:MAG TPA: acyl-CoA thioesterase [Lapillicoccus sp.]|nr:acyl-CoA thioesterase [Lapillicoccus sp.]